jgi:hypothetical protein
MLGTVEPEPTIRGNALRAVGRRYENEICLLVLIDDLALRGSGTPLRTTHVALHGMLPTVYDTVTASIPG